MTHAPTILLAEDDPAIRHSLALRLILAGFDVVTVVDGKDAKEAVDRRHIDAAVLEVQMPRRDGFEVCQHIRMTGRDIPVLLLTGAEDGVIRSHLGKLTKVVGGTHFMTKPYDENVLTITLKEALSRKTAGT